jgi:hypothetical protein
MTMEQQSWVPSSILRHSGIWGAADEAVLDKVHKKSQKILNGRICPVYTRTQETFQENEKFCVNWTSLETRKLLPLSKSFRREVLNVSFAETNLWGISYIPEAGVLKKLSRLNSACRLRYSWLMFGLASAGYRGLVVHDRSVCTAG